jgi:hypothetical protein
VLGTPKLAANCSTMLTFEECKTILNKEKNYSDKQIEQIITVLDQLLEIDIENFKQFCEDERDNIH